MKSIQEMFPRGSRAFLELNSSGTMTRHDYKNDSTVNVDVSGPKRARMTKPEREMSMILEARRRNNEIESWKFEGVTLKLADGCRFTPDFFVVLGRRVRFVETKGPFIREDSMIKFKIAREQNPWAEWELHQLNKNGWTQLF